MVAAVETQHLPVRLKGSSYRIGMWVGMAAILMMFTALSSAYIVRAASSNDWRPLAMPRILLLSTAVLLLSSVTLEIARRKLKSAVDSSPKLWFSISAALGIGFLVSQVLAWQQLRSREFTLRLIRTARSFTY